MRQCERALCRGSSSEHFATARILFVSEQMSFSPGRCALLSSTSVCTCSPQRATTPAGGLPPSFGLRIVVVEVPLTITSLCFVRQHQAWSLETLTTRQTRPASSQNHWQSTLKAERTLHCSIIASLALNVQELWISFAGVYSAAHTKSSSFNPRRRLPSVQNVR